MENLPHKSQGRRIEIFLGYLFAKIQIFHEKTFDFIEFYDFKSEKEHIRKRLRLFLHKIFPFFLLF